MVEWLSMAERGERGGKREGGRERARQRQVERKKRARRKSKQVAFMILSPPLAFSPFGEGERERERFRSLSNQPFESVAFRGDIGDIALGDEMKSTFK